MTTGSTPYQSDPDAKTVEEGLPFARLLARAALIAGLLVAAAAAVWVWLTADGAGDLRATIEDLFVQIRTAPYAPVLAVALLVVLNVAGVPLLVLTVGATVVFDNAWEGFAYSWLASMLGASAGYWLGRYSGAELLRRFGGERVNAVSQALGRRAILTCFLIRLVPTAPAIVVNMALGASHIDFGRFVIGTGLGIAPKLAFIVLVTKGLLDLDTNQGPWILAGLAVLVLAWLGTMFLLRRFVRRRLPGAESG